MKNIFKYCVIAAVLSLAQVCYAGDSFDNPRDILVDTIRNGHASGVVVGTLARKFQQQFNSDRPLLFEARKLYSYKQEGCARIAIDYTKQGIATLKTQINYCIDGSAPKSLEQAQ